jgi:hypothetical protein
LRGTVLDPGHALTDDAPQVMEITSRLERANASLERTKVLEAKSAAVWHATGRPLSTCNDWLGGGVPRGVAIIDHEPIDALALQKKNESLLDTVERIQRRGRELAADLHRTRCAPHPSAERKAAMRLQVAGWAEAGAPDTSASVALGGDIEFPTETQQLDIHSDPRSLGFLEMTNVVQTLAWLLPDQMVTALEREIDAEAGADVKAALSDADRQMQETTILADLLANDRLEVTAIELAAKQNITIDYRAETSPLALLGVSLITRGLGSM